MGNSVLIATTAAGQPIWEYLVSVFHLEAPGIKLFKHVIGKQGVDSGHNQLIKFFLERTKCDWMLHLDSDANVHYKTLLRLLSWDKPFVSALAFQRVPPFAPVYYIPSRTKDGWRRGLQESVDWCNTHPELVCLNRPSVLQPRPDDALEKVDVGGAHCLLVRRDVFEAIDPPWFERYGNNAKKGRGSDFDFYIKAKEAGFQPYLDKSIVAGHQTGGLCVNALNFLVWNRVARWNAEGSSVRFELGVPDSGQGE